MTTVGNQGQNVYPAPDNYPASSFPQPVPVPTVDPDDAGTLLTVQYSWEWQQVLLAAVDQLLNPATWQGEHDDIILAMDRAAGLKDLLQIPVTPASTEAETPLWDDAADVDDSMPADSQIWYGMVADVTAPPSGLTFLDDLGIWVLTGLVALTATPAAAIAFRTFAPKFVLAFKGDDVGEQIRVVIDDVDDLFFDTTGREGEIINIPIYPSDQSLSAHDILIMKVT